MENETLTSTEVLNIDGGWLETHWVHTYITKTKLATLKEQLEAADAKVAAAQAEKDKLTQTMANYADAIANAEPIVKPNP